MRVFSDTPYTVGHSHSMYAPGKPFMAVIVKGTFALVEGRPCTALPRKQQSKLGKPTNFMDEHGNSHKTPMDVSPFKLQADCLFIGSAHAPGGKPVHMLEAGFQVGAMSKTLSIYGNRRWVRHPDGSAHMTEPEAFTEMPIRAEYAHGGLTSKYNQHGIGFGPLGEEAGAFIQAANILPRGQSGISWERDGVPAGFGMLAPNLLPRRAFLGTYDGMWRTRRRPLPPADFNPVFFNAAPEDQRIDGYLAGDEEIVLRNLHPDAPEFRTSLPGTRVRCFVNRQMDRNNPGERVFAEVNTVLDTCIVDVPEGTLTLIWRGTVEIQNRRHERIEHLLVVEEPVGRPVAPESYAAALQDKLIDKRALAAQAAREERGRRLAEIDREGIAVVLGALREGKAPPELIAEVAAQTTIEDAQKIMLDWVEKTMGGLPTAGTDPPGV